MEPKKAAGKNKKAQPLLPQTLWRRLGREYLITNDAGYHARLGARDFALAVSGRLPEKSPLFSELASKGFIRSRLDFNDLAAKWKTQNAYLGQGPGLHILVLTLRCNHKCLYCQSGALGTGARSADMSRATARACVDFAFQSPNPEVTIEFQGGEPMLNWGTLEYAVRYARRKARGSGKKLNLALVSNFSLMNAARAEFLLSNEVSLCTSLDGPADLHNANRPFSGGNSHAVTVKWLKYFRERSAAQGKPYRVFEPSALLTVSRASLSRHKEIVDEYVGLGLRDIFVRPLAPIGYARRCWGKIGYNSEEFAAFYLKSLNHIIGLNRRGVAIREKMASMMLGKILGFRDHGYLDARCPCGAGIGQIAYGPAGDLYACDEGRMVGWEGNDLFRIGSVFSDTYRKVVAGQPVRGCAVASNLESQPSCSRCAYKPYCGVCPVFNYETQGSLWGNMPSNSRCGLFKGIFDALFALLGDPSKAKILKTWADKND